MKEARATAFVFSGRPDPSWDVPAEVVARLEALWAKSTVTDSVPAPPILGYRGSVLRIDQGAEYRAFGGVVTRQRGQGEESRLDAGREFERLLVSTAPEGLLPDEIIEDPGSTR